MTIATKSLERQTFCRLYSWHLWLVAFVTLAVAANTAAADGKKTKELPAFAKVEENVRRHFEELDRKPGDVISQGDVKQLFNVLALMGFKVPDEAAVVNKILKDNAFLIRHLRTKSGEKFMGQISNYPAGYDRLDRLSRLPQGRQMVQDLIKGPDGYKMIKYMTEAPGGEVLGDQIANAPKGEDFNKPTARIYTVEQLIERLKKSYQLAEEKSEPAEE